MRLLFPFLGAPDLIERTARAGKYQPDSVLIQSNQTPIDRATMPLCTTRTFGQKHTFPMHHTNSGMGEHNTSGNLSRERYRATLGNAILGILLIKSHMKHPQIT